MPAKPEAPLLKNSEAGTQVARWIGHWASIQPSKPAFIDEHDASVSFADLSSLLDGFDKSLASRGLRDNGPVAVYLPHGKAKATCLTILLGAGIPALVISTRLHPEEMKSLISQGIVRTILTDERFGKKISPSEPSAQRSKLSLGSLTFEQIHLRNPVRSTSLAAWFLLTSGSTGKPSIVELSWENIVQRTIGETELFQISSDSRLLNCLSFAHDLGFNQLLTSLYSGASLRILPIALPRDVINAFRSGRIDGVTGTPQLWTTTVLRGENLRTFDYRGFLTISGGHLSRLQNQRLRDVFPNARILKTYGQTETFRTFVDDRQDRVTEGFSGHPIRGVHARLLNQRRGVCEAGEIGELAHFGDGVMTECVLGSAATSKKFIGGDELTPAQPELGRGVLTGDYFLLNQDGEYRFIGRRDDLIKRMDHRVSLLEIQNLISGFDGVGDVCVMCVPGVGRNQADNRLVAWIEPTHGFVLSTQDIETFCLKRMSAYKVPDEFHVLDCLPKTYSEKIDRRTLLESIGQARTNSEPEVLI